MKSKIKSESVRETRKWWAVTEIGVQEVTGWSCAPSNPKVWWCPAAGYSMTEGAHIFPTKPEAIRQAIKELEQDIADSQVILKNLKAQL
jgi:hypothetical protein